MTTFKINNAEVTGENEATRWVTEGLTDVAILYAEKFGEELVAPTVRRNNELNKIRGEALTTSQIRNVYGEVVKMRMKDNYRDLHTPLLLLKPRLAYAAKRADKEGVRDLKKVMERAIDAVLSPVSDAQKDGGQKSDDAVRMERFHNFANFFEAVLAYHRAFGGK